MTFEYSNIKGIVEMVAAITNHVANTDFSIFMFFKQKGKCKITLDHAISNYKTGVSRLNSRLSGSECMCLGPG